MKRDDVKVDGTYWAKVGTGGVVPVKITSEKWAGDRHAGWVGVNTTTNRSVRIKTAQRLRGPVEAADEAPAGAATTDQAGGAGEEGAVTASAGSPRPRAAAGGKAGGAKAGAKAHAAKTTAKAAKAPKTAKAQKTEKAPAPAKPKRVSALDAAARVLAGAGAPMKPKEMVALMESTGLWTSPGGKTPEATLYSAIIREIAARKGEARFRKTERGTFIATEHASAAAASL